MKLSPDADTLPEVFNISKEREKILDGIAKTAMETAVAHRDCFLKIEDLYSECKSEEEIAYISILYGRFIQLARVASAK